jgi:hypothetical protein
MSKKKNKKLKKKQSHSGYIAPVQVVPAPTSPTVEMDVTPDLEEKVVTKQEEPKADGYNDPLYKDEKKVVTKILLIILGLVIILIGAYYLNQKTTILSSFGNSLYKILNIQTQ